MLIESNTKIKLWLYLILVLFAIGFTGQQAPDYRIYVSAGRAIVDDASNPFEPMTETEPDGLVTTHAQYRYAPIFGIALYPFSQLPKPIYIFLWLFLNAVLLVKTTIVFREFFPKLGRDNQLFILTAVLTLILSGRFWSSNFELGQTTIILVFLSVHALNASIKGRHVTAGLMLSAAIVIKIMPIVLIGYFIFRKDLKTPLYTLLFTFILVMLPSLIVGHEYNSFLIQEWYNIINPFNDEYTIETKTGIYNLSAFIHAYFTEMPDQNVPGYRNVMSLSYETARIVTDILRSIIVLFTLYFLKSMPFKKANSGIHSFWEFGYICFAFPLIFPAQNMYSFYYVIPILFYLAYYLVLEYKKAETIKKLPMKVFIPLLLFFIICTLSSSNVLGKQLYDQGQYYKIITFGIMLLLIPYAQIKPARIQRLEAELKDKNE